MKHRCSRMRAPTLAWSTRTSMPADFSTSAGPMPESCSSRGVWMLPSARITSRALGTPSKPVPVRTRTPTTASPSNNRLVASESTAIVRFGRFSTGWRNACRRADTLAVLDRGHRVTDAFVVALVQVVDAAHADRRAGRDHLVADRAPVLGRRDAERPVGATRRRRAELVAFDRLVRREDRAPTPTGVAELLEAVPVGLAAAVVDHAVHRARPAERLAAHPRFDPVGGPERTRREEPRELRVPEELAEAPRDADHQVVVLAARFEQQHAVRRVLRQAVGEHAAGRARAHDDVVELVHARQLQTSGRLSGVRGLPLYSSSTPGLIS